MNEVKEKLSSLTASVEKSAQGQLVERATHSKKIIKSDTVSWVHGAAHVHDDGKCWMSANTAYFTSPRAHPDQYWHWLYTKILCNVWDARNLRFSTLATSRI